MALPNSRTWYRLSNNYTGPGVFLSTGNLTTGSFLFMHPSLGDYSSNWQFLQSGNNYHVRNGAAGPSLQLGISYSTNNIPMPALQTTDTSSLNQEWSLTTAGAGLFGIENVALGNSVYLDTNSNTLQPFFQAWGYSGQLWTFTPFALIDDALYSTTAGLSMTQTFLTSTPTTTTTMTSGATSVSPGMKGTSSPATIPAEIPTTTPTSSSSSISFGAIKRIAIGSAIIATLFVAL